MKKLLALVMVACMVFGLVACGAPASQPAATETTTTQAAAPAAAAAPEAAPKADEPKPYDGVTLRVILASHDWTSAMQSEIPKFEAATGMKVEYEVYPEGQLSDKLNVELGSGGQYIDVFMCRPLQEVQQFIKNGFLAPVDDLYADPEFQGDDIIPATLSAYQLSGGDGTMYGAPLVTERQVLMYRKDLFEKAGLSVPTSLEEYEACAKALNGIEPGVVGVTMRGLGNPAGTQFTAYLFACGGDWIDFSGEHPKSLVNTPEAIKAFDFYGRMLREYGPADCLNMHWAECANLFSTGGAAMVTDADSIWKSFCGPDTAVYDKTGFALTPGQHSFNVCAWGLAISANSPNLAAAKEFVKWAAGVDEVKYIQTSGISSARLSAWNDPACTANYPADLLESIQKANEIATKAYDRPLCTSVAAARDAIGAVITASIEGKDVAAAAAKADAEFQKLLDEDFGG